MPKNQLFTTAQDFQQKLTDFNRELQEDEAKARAASLHLPYINLHNFPIDLSVLGTFTKEEAIQAQALPFFHDKNDFRIAAVNPSSPFLAEKLRELPEKFQVSLYLISEASLQQTIFLYKKVLRPKEDKDETVRLKEDDDYISILSALKDENLQLKKTATELIAAILGASLAFKSSDIHFEPEQHFVKVRFRVDGVLQDVLHISSKLQKSLTMRLKVIARLLLNVESQAQDGRLTFYLGQKPIDARVSVLPSAYGEEIVMRLLGTGEISLQLENLGFSKHDTEILEKALRKTSGIIITTGPTGSGKTTSLYAFLNRLNQPGVKIITLEDPVEYKLEGIIQTPIDHRVDFDFAKGLRAILRQDPDIVMVGEIRDKETAETAVQAALTGHLVLSTLHTNDAAGAIPRLLNMGVKPFVLAPAVNICLAQRLVRRLCETCKQQAKLSPQVLEKIKIVLSQLPKQTGVELPEVLEFYHSKGCAKCHNLGYKGRVGIYEIMEVSENIQNLILKEASMGEFRQLAAKEGMVSMLQDGLLKALAGITDVEEVFRVTGE